LGRALKGVVLTAALRKVPSPPPLCCEIDREIAAVSGRDE
jgi:hypothetical protein